MISRSNMPTAATPALTPSVGTKAPRFALKPSKIHWVRRGAIIYRLTRRGVIFVKVSQTGLEQDRVRNGIYAAVGEFLLNTGRIVSVVVYATVAMEVPVQKMTLLRHRFHEFLNSSHRFDKTKSWALFKDYEVPAEWRGAHPKWVRVFSQGFIMCTQ
jgi:hypothetical protein